MRFSNHCSLILIYILHSVSTFVEMGLYIVIIIIASDLCKPDPNIHVSLRCVKHEIQDAFSNVDHSVSAAGSLVYTWQQQNNRGTLIVRESLTS